MKELRNIIADNLIQLRKAHNLTQLNLAEKLNYSDKAVSKWERADTLPDIETLKAIADLYNISVDYLLKEHNETDTPIIVTKPKEVYNHIIITSLSITLVWFIALLIFVICHVVNHTYWQIFIWAIPVSSIVSLVFNSIWGKVRLNYMIISILMWSILLALYLQLIKYNVWVIFTVGIPGQIAIFLASLFSRPKRKENEQQLEITK